MQTQNFSRFLMRCGALFLGALSLSNTAVQAQRSVLESEIIVVHGGLFGGSDFAHIGTLGQTGIYTAIDTVRVNSVQDLYIERFESPNALGEHIGYLAAEDSIVKYDFLARQRLNAVAFGSVLTSRLRTSGDYLLVGNQYGSSNNNLRIFDKNTLAYIDSIPEIAQGVKDIVVIGDTAFIGQNLNDFSTNFVDSLGYISAIRVSTQEWLYDDTLNAMGYDLGRMTRLNADSDTLVSVNPISNTISYYNWRTRQNSTVAAPANVILQTLQTGNNMYHILGTASTYYMPFNDAIGRYDLATNSVVEDSFITHGQTTPFVQGFAFYPDANMGLFYVSKIDFINQANNIGFIYNDNGDSTGTFALGFSPEILERWYYIGLSAERQNELQAPSFVAFPNPTADGLQTLRAQASEQGRRLIVVDVAGRELQNIEWAAGVEQIRLDLSTYAAGIYWLQLRSDAQTVGRSWQRVQKL